MSMHIPLTPENFERLLKLAYIGESIVNDWTPDERTTDDQRRLTEVLYDLCAQAAGTPAEQYVTFDEASQEWIPSDILKEQGGAVLSHYDDHVFWDEVVRRLARRDLTKEYSAEAVTMMPERYRMEAENPMLEYYWHEVKEHGIDRLTVQEDPKAKVEERESTEMYGQSEL